MHALTQIACVAFGSTLGGLLRWGVGVAFKDWLGVASFWATLVINISGSFFLGWFSTVVSQRFLNGLISWISLENLRLLVAVGFTGAYTTFSTFEYEAHGMLSDGQGLKGTLYIAASVVVGLLAVRLGVMLGRS
ncbi:MAG: CrcB family protein [Gemmataceae bacterium]